MNTDNLFYIENEDKEKPVFRIFKLRWIIQLFESFENTLIRPICWDDPYENYILNHKIDTDRGPAKNMSRNFIHGQCWTFQNNSDALWRIYSDNKDGVQVKTTIAKLYKFLENGIKSSNGNHFFYIGKVQYDNQRLFEQLKSEFKNSPGFSTNGSLEAKTFLHKREVFSYEEELRIISFKWQKGMNNLLKIPFNPLDFVDGLILHPQMDSKNAMKLKKRFTSYGLNESIIEQSDLHQIDEEQLEVLRLNTKYSQ